MDSSSITPSSSLQQLMAVGGAGGSTIISGVASVALHALWLNANVKQVLPPPPSLPPPSPSPNLFSSQAVDAPRLHNQLQPNVTQYESNFPTVIHSTHPNKSMNNCRITSIILQREDI